MEPKVHAVFKNGKAQLVPEEHHIAGESPQLDKPYTFHILSLDTSDQGTFKQKALSRSHLSEVYDLYQDVSHIRKPDSHMILIGNGRLIKHSSKGSSDKQSINTPEIQSLIGRAIAKKFLPFNFNSPENSLTQTSLEQSKFVLNLSSTHEQPEIKPYNA